MLYGAAAVIMVTGMAVMTIAIAGAVADGEEA